MMKQVLLALLTGSLLVVGANAATPDLDTFLKRGPFGELRLSPDARHLAATVELEDRIVLVIIRREGMQPTAKVSGEANSAIAHFSWVDNERVVVGMADRYGDLDTPLPTGELHLLSVDGSRATTLFTRNDEGDPMVRSRAVPEARKYSYLIDNLPADPDRILVGIEEWTDVYPQTSVELMHLGSGRRRAVTRTPVRSATVLTDPAGQPRLAFGRQQGHTSKLFHRKPDADTWDEVNDEQTSGRVEFPLGFSPEGTLAYLQVSNEQGPDRIVGWNPVTGARVDVAADPRVDPGAVLRDGHGSVIGVAFLGNGRRTQYFDPTHPDARLQAMLDRSFAGSDVHIHPAPPDAPFRLIQVHSDRDPGSYFLFDVVNKHAAFLHRRLPMVDTAEMASMRSVDIKARDGLLMEGFLTRPRDANPDMPLPMILLPHGGPFGVFDQRRFDPEVQLLAAAGYAVLQVNFRGSGNYGSAFQSAGARQWGRAMQDDLTDATLWAINTNVTESGRICIVGASYGAYAAMMGVAREPALYACAVGYLGVYDLTRMLQDDRVGNRILAAWGRDWVGDSRALESVSPVRLADQIKVPVMLAAGGEDRVAPIAHSEMMERALKKSGSEVGTFYVKTAGHGFHQLEHRREYYRRLLTFLERHLPADTKAAERTRARGD